MVLRPKSLQSRIASFYDRTSHLWEVEWGEHMHHGYYPLGHTVRYPGAMRLFKNCAISEGILSWMTWWLCNICYV